PRCPVSTGPTRRGRRIPGLTRRGEMARINYVELPAANIAAAKDFYSAVFGWALTDFGPTYACTLNGDVDSGLQGDVAEATKSPLPVIDVEDLEAALAAVTKAGGRIVK